MPEGNPLVADAKKDPDGPGAFTAGNGDYGWAGGIGIAESSMDAFNGIKDGDWVSGGLGMLSLAGEIAGAAIDPFGYLMSSVASFLMEHVQPLKDMLDSVAGNPPVIQSYADTWGNVAKALGERKTDFDNAVKNGTTGWTGAGADAYRKFAAEHSDALSGAATVAGAISTVTMIMGQVVSFVRETVRQLIADLVGKLIAWVMEEVFSLGFGTPVVVAQASAAIAKWGKKIGELLKKLTDTIRKVSPLLSKLVDLFEKIAKVFGKVLGKVSGLDGLKVKEGGFVRKIPKEGGGVHPRAHGDGPDGDGPDGGHSGGDGDSPSADPDSPADGSSRRSSDRDSSPSRADGEEGAPSHAGDGDGSQPGDGSPSGVRSDESAPSHAGDGSPSHAGEGGSSPTRTPSHTGDNSPSPTRGSDGSPSHTGDNAPTPTRGTDSAPSRASDTSPSPTRGNDGTPSHTGDTSPSPTRGSDSTPSHTGDSSPSPTRGSDSTPSRASDSSPSPTRGNDGTPSHTGDNAPSRTGDSSPSPVHSGSSPAARSDGPGPHAGTDTPSAAPPRGDGSTSASGTAPAAPRAGEAGTVPSPRGGDGAASGVPPQGGAPMMGGMPPGGAPGGGGGGLGGGSPRTGGGGGWTGTPGSPGAHVDAPGRPRTGGDLPGGRPRTPDAPAPAARGFGPGTQGAGPHTPGPHAPGSRSPGTHTPGTHTPGTHAPDSRSPGTHAPGTRPHEGGPGHGPHDNGPTPHDDGPGAHDPDGGAPHHDGPLTPDEVNARHSESTPSGTSYHAGDPDMGDLPHRVHPDPDGRYTVDVHVTPDGHARIGDRLYTPEEFADVLRRNGDYDGRPVRLIGCDASSNDFAHRLSRELDTEVLAPTRPAWTDSHGRVFSSDYEIGPDGRMRPRIPPDGEWNVHRPDGSVHRAGDDGFAPDTHHADPHDVDADSALARGKDHPDMHDLDEGWQEPGFRRHENLTLGPNERFYDPANPRHLEPNTRYEVTDANGRFTRVYTNGDEPPRITHVDADVPNTRVGNSSAETGNPDASHLLGDVDYRVNTGEGHFEFHTDADGRPELDIDHFDPPMTPPPVERRITGYDPSHTGDGPFGATPPEDLQPNSRYEIYSTAPDGTEQWHGTFYTSGDNPPEFTHIKTWHDNERGMINPETGDQHTMHDQHAGRPDGMPVRGAKYEIGAENMHYHVDEHGNAAVSWEPDYSSPATKRVGVGPQERTGHIGQADHPGSTVNRGGHTADHRSGGLQGRMGMVPQLYEQNHSVGNPDNWRQMEIDRQTFERNGGDHGVTRVYADAPSVGETPDRLHVMSERIHPDGTRTYNYRSFPNVANPAPVVPPTRT